MRKTDPDSVLDELLVLQYKNGDKRALALLFKRWNKRILAYAFRNTKDMELAKDVAQEVWIVALTGFRKLKNPSKIGSWLLSIAHNKSMDNLKRSKRRREAIDTQGISLHEDALVTDERLIEMRKAIKTLNHDHRNILHLFYLDGFSLNEIGDILKLPKGTIKSRLFYARESLKNKLKKSKS